MRTKYAPLTSTLLIAMMLTLSKTHAQNEALSSMYNFNRLLINPAVAGTGDGTSFRIVSRKQWEGIQGAPLTGSLTVDSQFGNGRYGIGTVLISEKFGVMSNTHVGAVISRHFHFAPRGRNSSILSVGLKPSFNTYKADYTSVSTIDQDPSFSSADTRTLPNLGFGIHYAFGKFDIGMSIPSIFNANDYTDIGSIPPSYRGFNPNQYLHYFAYAGYSFTLGDHVTFSPSLVLKQLRGNDIFTDINIGATLNQKYTIGLSCRVKEGVKLMTQLQIMDNLQFGYAYTVGTTTIGQYNSGSHEVFISYQLAPGSSYNPRYRSGGNAGRSPSKLHQWYNPYRPKNKHYRSKSKKLPKKYTNAKHR